MLNISIDVLHELAITMAEWSFTASLTETEIWQRLYSASTPRLNNSASPVRACLESLIKS
jgi:hypothetical protein